MVQTVLKILHKFFIAEIIIKMGKIVHKMIFSACLWLAKNYTSYMCISLCVF